VDQNVEGLAGLLDMKYQTFFICKQSYKQYDGPRVELLRIHRPLLWPQPKGATLSAHVCILPISRLHR